MQVAATAGDSPAVRASYLFMISKRFSVSSDSVTMISARAVFFSIIGSEREIDERHRRLFFTMRHRL